MHLITWTSDFALGIDEIDEQHRALVDMINALEVSTQGDAMVETTRILLARLHDYVRDHFAFEERLMAGGKCSPELVARHCGEHRYFRGVLTDLTKEFEAGRRNVTITLIEYLVHWLLNHIVVVDRAMAHELNAAEPELGARVAEALMKTVNKGVTDSEHHLLTELRRANQDLDRQVDERTQALSEENARLEGELRELSARVEILSGGHAPVAANEPAAPMTAATVRTAFILLGHGAPDSEWAGPLRRVCEAVRTRAPDLRVALAFLEFMPPELRPCAEALIAEGFQRLVVVPMFMAQGGHLKRDVPQLLAQLQASHPQARLELAGAVGEAESVVGAMAEHVLALAGA